MTPNFEPPPLWGSILATTGGIVTAIALVVGLELWSAHLTRKISPQQHSSLAPVHQNFVSRNR